MCKSSFIMALRGLLALGVLVSLSACDTPPRRDPDYAASYPAVHANPAQSQAATGAIFQGGYDVALFEDLRARRIGDILHPFVREQPGGQVQQQCGLQDRRINCGKSDHPRRQAGVPVAGCAAAGSDSKQYA